VALRRTRDVRVPSAWSTIREVEAAGWATSRLAFPIPELPLRPATVARELPGDQELCGIPAAGPSTLIKAI